MRRNAKNAATRQKICMIIGGYHATHGVGPTYREIATALDLSLHVVHQHTSWLLQHGWLRHVPDKSRTLSLNPEKLAVRVIAQAVTA